MRLAGLAVLGSIALAGPAHATLIDFDDGVATSVIGGFYNALGVTFTGATWQSNLGLAGFSGPLGLGSTDANGYKYDGATPVIATFVFPVSTASVRVLDLGENGFMLNAYDAESGGNLVSTTTLFGVELGHNNF